MLKFRVCFGVLTIFVLLGFLFFSLDIPERFDIFRLKSVSQTRAERISPEDIFRWFSFSGKKALEKWKNKIFKGKTVYWIDEKDDEEFLHSKSQKTASALYHLVSYDIKDFPILSWKWRPIKFPSKEGITDPELKDDYALRLYVMFASGFFTNFKCIEYIWDESLKVGAKLVSPYSDKIMQLVIRSGVGTGDWVEEERNVLEDYVSLFGQEPKLNVRAIAIMSDSEGTQDSCEAHFKEIKIIKKL